MRTPNAEGIAFEIQPGKWVRVSIVERPCEDDWLNVHDNALATAGKAASGKAPSLAWRRKILEAKHSPIRDLNFIFAFEDIPSWVSVHYVRHVHAQPYVKSQRNDKQNGYDRNAARQDEPVVMRYSVNADELMTILNKRLCKCASPETRKAAQAMQYLVEKDFEEFRGLLMRACEWNGGFCHEMKPCGDFPKWRRPIPIRADAPLRFYETTDGTTSELKEWNDTLFGHTICDGFDEFVSKVVKEVTK